MYRLPDIIDMQHHITIISYYMEGTMMKHAFTLIELLIVVAIIAILAAIAVPNFLEAQTRAKVSRAKNDLRTVKTAVEAYRVDNNKAPDVNTAEGYALPGGQLGAGRYAMGLTSPIAYIASIPGDPFGKIKPDDAYAVWGSAKDYWYWTNEYCRNQSWGGNGASGWEWGIPSEGNFIQPSGKYTRATWMTYSKGPWGYWAKTVNGSLWQYGINDPWLYQYDPTNGTNSIGNIPAGGI